MDNKKSGFSIIGKKFELPTDQIQLDLASKAGDNPAINVVNKDGAVIVSFGSKGDADPFVEWFMDAMAKFKKQRKTLLWAVTHGYVVTIMIYDEKTGEHEFPIHTPKLLKKMLSVVPFVPELNIYTKDGDVCYIKKGRIVVL